MEMATAGGYPTVTYLWLSTSHNGPVSSCRGGVVRLSINVPINVRLNRSVAYSDDKRQTSWSLFDTALVSLPQSLIYITHDSLFTVVNQPVSNNDRIFTDRGALVAKFHYAIWFGAVVQRYGLGLANSRSWVQIPLEAMLRNNLGQAVHTCVPLSPSSITSYQRKGGDAVWLRR